MRLLLSGMPLLAATKHAPLRHAGYKELQPMENCSMQPQMSLNTAQHMLHTEVKARSWSCRTACLAATSGLTSLSRICTTGRLCSRSPQ